MPADESRRLEIQYTGSRDDAVGFAVVGAGPPVVLLLPFLPPIRAQWLTPIRRFIKRLVRDYQVILLDDRYYAEGRSEANRPIPDEFMHRLVSDIHAVIKAAGGGRCPVIASYLAAIPAITLAARESRAVESLLLWDAVLTGAAAASGMEAKAFVDLQQNEDPAVATRAWVAMTGMTASAEEVEEYRRMFIAMRDHPAASRIAIRGLAASDAGPVAASVQCPTLVVVPDGAILPGPGLVEAVARAVPGARLSRVRSAATAPHLEDPDLVVPLISSWLDEHHGGEGSRSSATSLDILTPRELEVSEQVALGQTNPEIADALSISRWTVQRHVANAMRKTGANNRAELAVRVTRGRRE